MSNLFELLDHINCKTETPHIFLIRHTIWSRFKSFDTSAGREEWIPPLQP